MYNNFNVKSYDNRHCEPSGPTDGAFEPNVCPPQNLEVQNELEALRSATKRLVDRISTLGARLKFVCLPEGIVEGDRPECEKVPPAETELGGLLRSLCNDVQNQSEFIESIIKRIQI